MFVFVKGFRSHQHSLRQLVLTVDLLQKT